MVGAYQLRMLAAKVEGMSRGGGRDTAEARDVGEDILWNEMKAEIGRVSNLDVL